jgi:uncharacterized protein YbaP (TraB family)
MSRALDEAEVVVFEVDPDSLQAPDVQTFVMKHALFDDGGSLKSELGDSLYAVASAQAESLGVDIDTMGMFRPWFVSVALVLQEMQRMGFDPALGIEMHFAGEAKAKGKSILGLETATYQLGLLVNLRPEQQREFLMHTLSQLADIESELGEILAAWKKGDLSGVEDTLNRSFKDYPEIYETIVLQRNRNWVVRIEDFLRDGRTHLVIVGVGHMPGKDGLVELLKQKGFEVQQL